MIGRSSTQFALIDSLTLQNRSTRSDRMLTQIDGLICWDRVVLPILATYAKTGRPSLDAVVGLKCMLLMQLYNLSYPELEEQVNDRLSFRRFLGLGLSDNAPDYTTFWKFHERLTTNQLYDLIFTGVLSEIEAKGFVIKQGTLIDATLLDANRKQPKSTEKADSKPRSPQQDRDATSTKKHHRHRYGYKGSVGVDHGSGLIRRQCFTTAATHDSKVAERLISGDEFVVYGDKAYHNNRIKRFCDARMIGFGIMEQKRSNRPLPHASAVANKLKGIIRYAVERTFAQMKRVHKYTRVRSVTLARNAADFALFCAGYNLKRCVAIIAQG